MCVLCVCVCIKVTETEHTKSRQGCEMSFSFTVIRNVTTKSEEV